ncbi:hypothetical protein [Paenibacillus sp. YN15]|uniref:hypothetical protein n=1 Tax=Paenibacillus sp. YN15 TaxID=1742774 RepID=UPI000DCBB3AD|nr:hypothetical protein [Paenibacillus sp. YN15]RAU94039.1 hypothetical protein DQG13_24715 [Paenibacillus sp. YN15]
MILTIVETCIWIGMIYLLERRRLKKTNAVTRWTAVGLLLASGIVWQALVENTGISRPYEWIDALLGPMVPVP